MATTIQQVVGEASSTPICGKPFNFRKLFDFYQLPRVVAADPKLPPGARLLWAVIYRYCWNQGACTASDETLARALAVSRSQFIRHARALEKAGLMQATPRPGKTALRELLWDARFAGKVREGVSHMTRGGVINDMGGMSHMAPPYKEEDSSSISFKNRSAATSKNPAPKPPAPPAQKPAVEWTEEDYIARGRLMGFPEHVIQRDLERLRARRAKPTTDRLVKPAELAPEVVELIRR